MRSKGVYRDFCTGCGLCHSVYGVELNRGEDGYLYPDVSDSNKESLSKVCPAGGRASKEMDCNEMWGRHSKVYLGWSTDSYIREQASSGGALTSLCCYLLDNKKVDGIIQTIAGEAYNTKTVVSRISDEVKCCMGSRYSVSAPLLNLKELIKPGEKYAFVGKPCDVSALRMYLKEDKQLAEQIVYLFSFFCAGTPSLAAQKKLLEALGCKDERDCLHLQYRGNGWPGFATVTKKDGTSEKMSYSDSWGKILGRDVRRICRYCLDGIGEMADISCGDAWYLTPDMQPDFSEKEGRNVIFARSDKGLKLIEEAMVANVLEAENYVNCFNELKLIQKYQYERRATMHSMILGLKVTGRMAPKYSGKTLRGFSKNASLKLKMRRFSGTVKRAVKGKI